MDWFPYAYGAKLLLQLISIHRLSYPLNANEWINCTQMSVPSMCGLVLRVRQRIYQNTQLDVHFGYTNPLLPYIPFLRNEWIGTMLLSQFTAVYRDMPLSATNILVWDILPTFTPFSIQTNVMCISVYLSTDTHVVWPAQPHLNIFKSNEHPEFNCLLSIFEI